jgi:hypothetical protein
MWDLDGFAERFLAWMLERKYTKIERDARNAVNGAKR